MFNSIMILVLIIFIVVSFKFFFSYLERIDEDIVDMEIRITDLEVKNTKMENEIKIISQSLNPQI